MTTPKRIHLLGTGRHEEGVAGAAIMPGDLIEKRSDGKYYRSNVVGETIERTFAIEDALQGKTINDVYVTGSQVSLVIADRGDVILANLSSGENVVIGDNLSSQGDGTLKKETGSGVVVVKAEEAVNASDSTDERIRVRVI